MKEIDDKLYAKLVYLGIINEGDDVTRTYNVGSSNYSEHIVQPWSIWLDWELNPWDADIIKRILRTKNNCTREEDYEKIKHICDERLRQLRTEGAHLINEIDFEEVD